MNEKRYVFGWWLFGGVLLILSAMVTTGLHYAGVFTGTVVERKVFENSYQYSEARKTEQLEYQATLSQIEAKLANPELSETDRTNLNAQKSAIEIRLNVSRNR